MKKLILAAVATTCALSVFAQGTVVFNNRVAGTVVSHVYAGPAAFQGNGPGDTPAGTNTWGAGYVLIGTTGGLTASTTFAQLLAAPGFGAAESSLVPALGVTTFRTGGGAGNVAGITATLGNVAPNASAATLEMVAWDNSSGLYPTWAQASVAWKNGLIAAGESGTWNQDAIGGTQPAPNLINSTDPTQHVQSFSLVVPEPTTAVLAGLGAAAMLIFRRRK